MKITVEMELREEGIVKQRDRSGMERDKRGGEMASDSREVVICY